MRGEFWLINHRRDIPDVIKNFHDRLNEMDFSRPIAWKFETYSTVRSLSQNALFHMWCGQMSEYFSSKISVTPEMVKKLMKNEFLGTEISMSAVRLLRTNSDQRLVFLKVKCTTSWKRFFTGDLIKGYN